MKPSQWALDLLLVAASSFLVTLAISHALAQLVGAILTPLTK
jgi:hypothetical protein